ncbi:peptidylprolyl isomerase [Neptunicoccus sediminis]|uniref:peptidylprolyl isomerase n=1 Tax=Neptunicoccus sediminis TaxID=1892596 RepID=UPI000845E9C1|nr:peptidylprolyl isomerase [Neptunicoccus sediminis]
MKSLALTLIAGLMAVAPPAVAQSSNPYAVAIRVNDGVVTNFEVNQRILLLQAFGTTGDLRKTAQEQLIEDRLRLQAAKRAGLTVTDEEIEEGVAEFAGRANLSAEQLYQFVAQRGAARESMQDFVRAGLLWRNLVQARFAGRANVSDSEVDTTLNLIAVRPSQSILFSEIRLPLNQQTDAQTLELAESLSKSIRSEAAFAAAARRYSRAPSRARSGRLDWLPVAELPPALAGQIMALQPGEVTAPVTLGATVGLFQLRGVRNNPPSADQVLSVSYTTVDIPGEPGSERLVAEATDLINDVDTCKDLRAESERYAVPGYTDHTQTIGTVPDHIAVTLAGLDRHEASYYTNTAGTLSVVMLCDRTRDLPEGTRDNIRNGLFNQRVGALGQGYLQELKGDAVIVYP